MTYRLANSGYISLISALNRCNFRVVIVWILRLIAGDSNTKNDSISDQIHCITFSECRSAFWIVTMAHFGFPKEILTAHSYKFLSFHTKWFVFIVWGENRWKKWGSINFFLLNREAHKHHTKSRIEMLSNAFNTHPKYLAHLVASIWYDF